MDGKHVDQMVRSALTRGSRRGALRALAGGLLVALTPAAGAAKAKRRKKPNRGPRCAERCGGRCRRRCPDVMTRNPSTCACECPEGMHSCGEVCVGDDRCCPGEKTCGGGCIREEDCCTHTHKECADGSCVAKGSCCPVLESPCPGAPSGCCPDGLACASDGCCPVSEVSDVCNGACTDLDTNDNCGACGNACGSCKTCRRGQNGAYACTGPEQTPTTCEVCVEGDVVPGQPCGDRCCGPTAECCGNGCCAQGMCRVQNGVTCCLKVEDNRLVCRVL